MALKRNLLKVELANGTKIEGKRRTGALCNLISSGNGLVKRKGHKNVITIKDALQSPLRINGIFSYSYIKNGEIVKCKIVHAGGHLFELNEDFSSPRELTYDVGIKIKDARSSAFLMNESLFIVGAGDLLIYDGIKVKRAYENENAYVPVTAIGITDNQNGAKSIECEGANLLTPRRINKLIGANTKYKSGKASVFLLDEKIANNSKFVLEAKIRTRTSDEEVNENNTSYIGIDADGNEVSTIVTLRYERDSLGAGTIIFLAEPILDEQGAKIRIKYNDKICDFDELPFGVSISNKREISLGFEVPTPWQDKENITVEYEAEVKSEELCSQIEMGTVTNGAKGGQVLALTLGGNDIYFSDEERGFFYLPKSNKISLGSDGEKITSLIQLWDNIFGAFKKDSFFRVVLTGGAHPYEVYTSSDTAGAYSIFSSCHGDDDCLVFNERGVFGVSDYKSLTNVKSALSQRSSDICSELKGYSEEEKQNATSLFFDGYYYLFIGENAYIADTRQKRGASSNSEYSWYFWKNVPARAVFASASEIYFGTEGGQIRRLYDGFCDADTHTYSVDNLTLSVNNDKDYTVFVIDKTMHKTKAGERIKATLGAHKRLIKKEATVNDLKISLLPNELFAKDGGVKLFEGDAVALVAADGTMHETQIEKINPYTAEITLSYGELDSNEKYDLYLVLEKKEYEVNELTGGCVLIDGGEKIKVLDTLAEISLTWTRDILCQYETEPFMMSQTRKGAVLKRILLTVFEGTCGEIFLEARTKKTNYLRTVKLAPVLSFDSLSFNALSFDASFDTLVPVQMIIRDFDYIAVSIKTENDQPFSLGAIYMEGNIIE